MNSLNVEHCPVCDNEERIKELLSIIWLLVWAMPNHEAVISEESRLLLRPEGKTFTTWTELENDDFVIKAEAENV